MDFEIVAIECTNTGGRLNLVCAPNCSIEIISGVVKLNHVCPAKFATISNKKSVVNLVCSEFGVVPANMTINAAC
ncbi:MAG: hypothetical protein FWG65_09180 [Turicibacter sp.]|nr:hypothetical protein [Turicibacter sp.]